MLPLLLYLIVLFLEISFLIVFSIYTFFLIYSTLKGSPYLPTKNKQLQLILNKARLRKKQVFLDLGCGDGRVIRAAVKNFKVKGIGIDINPLILLWAKFITRMQKIKPIKFYQLDITKSKFPSADVIYIFLMPKLIEKISEKLKKQLLQGTLIISHGFKIKYLSQYLKFTLDQKPFPTYFYKI